MTAVERECCTALYGVPTMFIAELALPNFERFDLSSLRTGIMAGAPCPIEVMRQVVDRMHMSGVTIAYGMTETSPVSFQTDPKDPLERRVTTIGRVQPHLEVKAIDLEGQITPRGVPGEFCTRGYSVMLGYWDGPGQRQKRLTRMAGCTRAILESLTKTVTATSSDVSIATLSKPDDSSVSVAVDFGHHGYLGALFPRVCLIDAHSVNPKSQRLRLL